MWVQTASVKRLHYYSVKIQKRKRKIRGRVSKISLDLHEQTGNQNQLVTLLFQWNHRTTVLESCQISDQRVGSLSGRWRHGYRDGPSTIQTSGLLKWSSKGRSAAGQVSVGHCCRASSLKNIKENTEPHTCTIMGLVVISNVEMFSVITMLLHEGSLKNEVFKRWRSWHYDLKKNQMKSHDNLGW